MKFLERDPEGEPNEARLAQNEIKPNSQGPVSEEVGLVVVLSGLEPRLDTSSPLPPPPQAQQA